MIRDRNTLIARLNRARWARKRARQGKEMEKPKAIQGDKEISVIQQGDTIDIRGLLFSPERNFLIKDKGTKVTAAELQGKTIVVLVVALQEEFLHSQVTADIIDAYHELSYKNDVAFVFVAVQTRLEEEEKEKAYFDQFLTTIPFPTIPFNDTEARDKVVEVFKIEKRFQFLCRRKPYWSIINSEKTVEATSTFQQYLFSIFAGAELYPFDKTTINNCYYSSLKPRDVLRNLEQLLASPPRNFLLLGDEEILISSLENKVIGLCFCENILSPRLKELLKKVYDDAKKERCAFEIVQTRFHVDYFSRTRDKLGALSVRESCDDCEWLRVPFKDPSQKKLLRIFHKYSDKYSHSEKFAQDFLVIVDRREGRLHFEFSGAEILKKYGVAGYPFTRQYLSKLEYKIQKESATLELLFPTYDFNGKKVLVLFASLWDCKYTSSHPVAKFVGMLKDKYNARHLGVKEDEFEVVYVSYDYNYDLIDDCKADMPWIMHPYSKDFVLVMWSRLFKAYDYGAQVAAFNEGGELIAKELFDVHEVEKEQEKFPFVSTDLEGAIYSEVETMCQSFKQVY